jgi:hypothetical protein
MANDEDFLICLRQSSQLLVSPNEIDTHDIVQRLVGVQAQDDRGARWSIGLRSQKCTDEDVLQSIRKHEILRTWLFRGTLHYLAGDDFFWLMDLISPLVIEGNARRYNQLGLSDASFEKSRKAIQQVIKNQGEASRTELKNVFKREGIPSEGQQVPYLLQRAALEGLIYISSMRGRDMAFRLVSELGLPESHLGRQTALVQLAERYFRGHSPATVHDFAWWSGLPVSEARNAIAGCEDLEEMGWVGKLYFFIRKSLTAEIGNKAFLLPSFDDYLLSYNNRDVILDSVNTQQVKYGGGMFRPTVLINGLVVGTWRMDDKKSEIHVNIQLFGKPKAGEHEMIESTGRRMADFYQKPVSIN